MTDIAVRSEGSATDSERETVALMVNGEERRVARGTTLDELLRALSLDPRLVVVEHNRTILRDRALYPTLTLRPGDALEIVHFVAGG